jgi:hypothetical protein
MGTTVLGAAYFLVVGYRKLTKYLKNRPKLASIPRPVQRTLKDINKQAQRLAVRLETEKKPRTFGVYLGAFNYPPTPHEARLLKEWEVILLDPLQPGVLDAIEAECTSQHRLGRLDMNVLAQADSSDGYDEMAILISLLTQTIMAYFKKPGDPESRFTGVVIANWMAHFPPIVFNEIIKHLDSLGLNVYLEMSPPNFIPEDVCLALHMQLVRGIVCRNGSILPNGDRRNYFQMSEFRPAMEALVGQASMNDGFIMMWETHSDDVAMDHAIVKRSYTWGRFTSCICWIGPESALTNAEIAVRRSVIEEPLGALMWLKEEEIIKIQDTWRLNDRVSPPPHTHPQEECLQALESSNTGIFFCRSILYQLVIIPYTTLFTPWYLIFPKNWH